MPFGTATVVTTLGKKTIANRLQTTPTLNPIKFLAMGNGATIATRTAVVGDTALSAERETRVSGTESLPGSTNIYQALGTITATANYNTSGAGAPIDEAALFDAVSSGNMGTSATFAVINLASGDSIQFTWQITIS